MRILLSQNVQSLAYQLYNGRPCATKLTRKLSTCNRSMPLPQRKALVVGHSTPLGKRSIVQQKESRISYIKRFSEPRQIQNMKDISEMFVSMFFSRQSFYFCLVLLLPRCKINHGNSFDLSVNRLMLNF